MHFTQVTEQLGHLVRMVAEMETSMIAVERIKKYVDLDSEVIFTL